MCGYFFVLGGLIKNLGLFPVVEKTINYEDIIINRVRTDGTDNSFIKWDGFCFDIISPIGYVKVNGKKIITES